MNVEQIYDVLKAHQIKTTHYLSVGKKLECTCGDRIPVAYGTAARTIMVAHQAEVLAKAFA